jgi:Phage-related minor tail protein
MTDAKAIIRISAMPDSALRKAIDRSVGEATRASKAAAAEDIKAAKQAEREKLRASKSAERAAAAASRAAIKAAQDYQKAVTTAEKKAASDAQRAAQQQARTAEKLAKEEVRWTEWAERLKYKAVQSTARMAEREAARNAREAQKSARQQIRDAERQSRIRYDQRRQIGAAVGGAVVGAGAAALGRVQSFAGTFGARSNEEMMAQVVDMHRRLVVLSDMGGPEGPKVGELKSKILAVSARTGVEASDLVAALEAAQDRFSDLKGFTAILDQVADVAIASKTSVASVVSAMGVMRRQFKLTDQEMQQLGGAMVSAADLGSVSFDELANSFGNALGAMGRNANLGGLQGAIKALALAQTLGEADIGAPEASTLGVRVVSALNDTKVQESVKRAFGVDITKEGKIGGELRDLPTIIQELANKGFMGADKGALRQAIFTEERGQRGMEVLVKQFQDKPERVKELLGLRPEEGAEAVRRRVVGMTEGVEGQAATLAARQFKTFMEGDTMKTYMDAAVKSADTLATFKAGHPIMTEVIGIAGDALKGIAMAVAGERMLNLGARLVPGAASLGTAATGVGATAAGVGAGTVLAAAGTGLVAAGATTLALDALGVDPKLWGAGLYNAFNYEQRSKTRGTGATAAELTPGYTMASPEDYQSREPIPWSPAAPPLPAQQVAPEATLKIKYEGPLQMSSVTSDGFGDIEFMSVDTGRRTILTP